MGKQRIDVARLELKGLENRLSEVDTKGISAGEYLGSVADELAAEDPGKLMLILDLIEQARHTEFADAVTTAAAKMVRSQAEKNQENVVGFMHKQFLWLEDKIPFLGRFLLKFVNVKKKLAEGYEEAAEYVAQFLEDFSRPEDA